jgi:hypothetical protein
LQTGTYDSLAEAAEVKRAWRDLSSQSEELAEACELVLTELTRQTSQVDRIEDHVATAREATLVGAGEVVSADETKAKSWAWKGGGTGAVVGGAVGIIGGPVGVAVGAAVGTSIGSLIGSIPKWMVSRDCEKSRATLSQLQGKGAPESSGTMGDGGTSAADDDPSASFREREEMHVRAAMEARRRSRGAAGGGSSNDGSSSTDKTATDDDPEVTRLKLNCLENALRAMRATTDSAWILNTDRESFARVIRDDGDLAKAQSVAGSHLTGIEYGWLSAFFYRRKGSTVAPSRAASISSNSNKPGLLQRIRAMVMADRKQEEGDEGGRGGADADDEVVTQIEVILRELKQR